MEEIILLNQQLEKEKQDCYELAAQNRKLRALTKNLLSKLIDQDRFDVLST